MFGLERVKKGDEARCHPAQKWMWCHPPPSTETGKVPPSKEIGKDHYR